MIEIPGRKKLLFFFLIFVTAFNLAGGYAFAASLHRAPAPAASESSFTVAAKHADFLQNQPQLFKDENQDDDLVFAVVFPAFLPELFKFSPEFKVCSRHFLIHYATAIKAELPATYLLGQVFRL